MRPFIGHLLTLALSATYVSSIYVSSRSRTASRDHPDVIKARLSAVSLATFLCVLFVTLVLEAPWHLLGFSSGLGFKWEYLRPHLVTPVLYLGPIYAIYLNGTLPGMQDWSWDLHVKDALWSWQGIRNILLAPPTEEIVFRACTLTVLYLAGVSKTKLIFISPLSFGIAHLHHAYETYNRYGKTKDALKRALAVTLFQFAYSTLFGIYTSYLFLRTSSIWPAISAHMFCNFMGLPQIDYELKLFFNEKTRIILAYIVGVIGFMMLLGPWTRVSGEGYWSRLS